MMLLALRWIWIIFLLCLDVRISIRSLAIIRFQIQFWVIPEKKYKKYLWILFI